MRDVVIGKIDAMLAAEPKPAPGSTVKPSRDRWPATEEQVEAEWQTYWAPIVAPDGEVNVDQIKLELFDFSQLMVNAAEVYMHVTGGKISKVTTLPELVIAVADDHINQLCDEGAASAVEPEPAPAPYVVTDAMVAAAGVEIYQAEWDSGNDPMKDAKYWRNKVRAALEAAERVRRGG